MDKTGKDIEKQCNRMCFLNGKALYASKQVESLMVIKDIKYVYEWLRKEKYEHIYDHVPLSGENEHVYVILGQVKGNEGETYETHVVIDDSCEDKVLAASCNCADFPGGTKFCEHCVAVAHNFVMQCLEDKLAEKLVKPDYLIRTITSTFQVQTLEERKKELEQKEQKKKQKQKKKPKPLMDATGRILEQNGYASVNSRQGRDSSSAIVQLIKTYSGMDKMLQDGEWKSPEEMDVLPGTVELVPNLTEESEGKWAIDFRVGVEKKYVIKDILEFADLMKKGEYHSYGKSLGFVHERSAFTPQSQFYLDIIEDVLSLQSEEMVVPATMRYMRISPGYLERIFHYIKEQPVSVNGEMFHILEADPKITVKVEKAEYGCTVTVPYVVMIQGIRQMYVLIEKEHKIYMTSKGFAKHAAPFFQAFQTYRDWNYTYTYAKKAKYTCFLNNRDYASFCGHVLRKLDRYIVLQEENMELAQYMPPECELLIYLDAPDEETMTCNIKARYGKEEYNVADWAATSKGNFRDLGKERAAFEVAKKYFPVEKRQGKEYLLYCREEERMYELLQYGIKELEEYGEMYVSENIRKINIRTTPKVSAGVQIRGSLLELSVSIPDMSDDEVGAILSAYRLKQRYYRMKNGDFMELKESGLSLLSDMSKGLNVAEQDWVNGTVQVPVYRVNFVDAMLKERGSDLTLVRSKEFRSIIRNMKEIEDSDYEVPETIQATLRGYQKTGYRWLKTLASYGFGGILADDMGLGKTLQVITLLESAIQEEGFDTKTNTSLIVCPASLIYNWESECRKFAPNIRVRVIVGTAQDREELLQNIEDVDLLVTSYDLLKRDLVHYEEKQFAYMIVDEAQYIKNATTQVAQAVKMIHAKQHFALTGTPVENRLSDLWSIFDFIMPGYLYEYEHFKTNYEQPIVLTKDENALRRLQKMVSPFILRRRKKDVLKDLPDKIEHIMYMNMTEEQREYYNARFVQLQNNLYGKAMHEVEGGEFMVLSEITRLRQLCCDPQLFVEGYQGGSGKVEAFLSMAEELK